MSIVAPSIAFRPFALIDLRPTAFGERQRPTFIQEFELIRDNAEWDYRQPGTEVRTTNTCAESSDCA